MEPTPELRQALIRAAIALWGQPTKKGKVEWRFGRLQSKSIDLEKLVWRDHEADEGAGVLELCTRAGIEPPPPATPMEIAYPYHDETGKLLKEVLRRPGHKFVQRRPNQNGGWTWDTKGVANTPYRLPELLAAHGDEEVFLVEGEKDVDNVRRLGLVASCNAGGAGKWSSELNKWFRARDIVILPDNDAPGVKHANQVAEELAHVARSVRIVALPDLPEKGDVSDWIGAGGTREQLLELLSQAAQTGPDVSGVPAKPETFTAAELEHKQFPPVRTVVPGLLIEGLTLIAGKPKIGKSFLMLQVAIAVAGGLATLGSELSCDPGDVLYAALEDTWPRLQRRIAKLDMGWPGGLQLITELPRLTAGGMGTIRSWLDGVAKPRLVIIDTLELIRDRQKPGDNGYAADYAAVLELRKLANQRGIALVVVHHLRKAEADDPFDTVSGTLGLTGAPDAILVLTRDQGGGFTLRGKGRELEEIEKVVRFDRNSCRWELGADVSSAIGTAWDKRKALTLLRRALIETIARYGLEIKPWPDGPQVRAVDQEHARNEFYKAYPAPEVDLAADKLQARRKAFARSIKDASNAGLITSRDIDGRQMVWFATAKTPS